MRLRNNPKAKDILATHNQTVIDPYLDKQQDQTIDLEDTSKQITHHFSREEIFGNNHPVYIEIGMGKGDFIVENALRYPEINFIGIEKYDSVIAVALNKLDHHQGVPKDPDTNYRSLPNLRMMSFDAEDLLDYFEEDSIDRIYLNFSDPWPKSRHDKRRLTHENYLRRYQKILKKPGSLEFKTDNRGLFEFSIISFNKFNLEFEQISLDLHHSEYMEGNIMTEYERKFSPKGPIYKIIVKFK